MRRHRPPVKRIRAVAALEQWPESGVPDNPGAWLMATAKHRAIDRLRRAEVHQRKIARQPLQPHRLLGNPAPAGKE
jgi:predicted RNA polymerase sigma factor